MKTLLIIGATLVSLALIAAFAIPAFAQEGSENTTPGQSAWQRMYDACQNGDWDDMIEAAQEFHGQGNVPGTNAPQATPPSNSSWGWGNGYNGWGATAITAGATA